MGVSYTHCRSSHRISYPSPSILVRSFLIQRGLNHTLGYSFRITIKVAASKDSLAFICLGKQLFHYDHCFCPQKPANCQHSRQHTNYRITFRIIWATLPLLCSRVDAKWMSSLKAPTPPHYRFHWAVGCLCKKLHSLSYSPPTRVQLRVCSCCGWSTSIYTTWSGHGAIINISGYMSMYTVGGQRTTTTPRFGRKHSPQKTVLE